VIVFSFEFPGFQNPSRLDPNKARDAPEGRKQAGADISIR